MYIFFLFSFIFYFNLSYIFLLFILYMLIYFIFFIFLYIFIPIYFILYSLLSFIFYSIIHSFLVSNPSHIHLYSPPFTPIYMFSLHAVINTVISLFFVPSSYIFAVHSNICPHSFESSTLFSHIFACTLIYAFPFFFVSCKIYSLYILIYT